MNRLRKIARWLWVSKERMVLAVMVIFLCFRVYQVVQPPPPPTGNKIFQPPRGQLPPEVETPGTPPRIPDDPNPGNWTDLWLNNPFIYVSPGDSRRRSGNSDQVLYLEVLSFQEVSDGNWRVRIRSASRRGWYSEGDAFETYELLSIDPDNECIVVFAEELGRREEICKNQ